MAMADVREKLRPMALVMTLTPTDDRELTCIVCYRGNVEYEFQTRVGGSRSAHGIHRTCAESAQKLNVDT